MSSVDRKILQEIKDDKTLAPYFIDYVGEHLKMRLAILHRVDKTVELQIRQRAYKSLLDIVTRLQGKVDEDKLYTVIERICQYYLQVVVSTEGNTFTMDSVQR